MQERLAATTRNTSAACTAVGQHLVSPIKSVRLATGAGLAKVILILVIRACPTPSSHTGPVAADMQCLGAALRPSRAGGRPCGAGGYRVRPGGCWCLAWCMRGLTSCSAWVILSDILLLGCEQPGPRLKEDVPSSGTC